MDRDELIAQLALVLAGLQVPLSLPGSDMRLGTAREPYVKLLSELPGFGWRDAADFEAGLREVLG